MFRNHASYATALTVAAAVSVTLAGCATAPVSPDGAAEVRAKLTRLQSDPDLATRAPVALKEAETAVLAAEAAADEAEDSTLGTHRVYIADRKVEIAMAQAATGEAEDQRVKLAEEREKSRLDARTREADAAHADADATRVAAAGAATAAALKAEDMQRQIDALQAKTTERGIVLTLGDVLFTSGQADLKAGTASNLDRLVAFLNQNPERTRRDRGPHRQRRKRRLQPGTFATPRGFGEVVPGAAGHRFRADRCLRNGRASAGRGQPVRGRPPAEPPRRSDHRQSRCRSWRSM